jgi:hypothetical protein
MTALFIAAVPSDKVNKSLAGVRSNADNANAWAWKHPYDHKTRGPIVIMRYLGNVSEVDAKKALQKLHVMAPVSGVRVRQDWEIFNDKLSVGISGLHSFADAVYDLTRHIGAQSKQSSPAASSSPCAGRRTRRFHSSIRQV